MYYKRKHIRNGNHYYTTYHGYINNVLIEPQILPQDTEYSDHSYIGKANGESIYLGDKVIGYADGKPILGVVGYMDEPVFAFIFHPLGPTGEIMKRYIELSKLEDIQKHQE